MTTANWQSLDDLAQYCIQQKAHKIGIISVGKSIDEITRALPDLPLEVINTKTNLPIILNYDTPDTLGIDRVVACIGAREIIPDEAVLVIDMGTCITYDVVDKTGTYHGGVIAPGLKMRMKAMHNQTHSLPDISWDWVMYAGEGLGKSTKACLARGAHQAIIHEIHGFINDFRSIYPQLVVMITGGDAIHFESKLKEPIFADLNLVLKGINTILNH